MELFEGWESWVKHLHVMLGEHTDATLSMSKSFTVKNLELTNEGVEEGRLTSSIWSNESDSGVHVNIDIDVK